MDPYAYEVLPKPPHREVAAEITALFGVTLMLGLPGSMNLATSRDPTDPKFYEHFNLYKVNETHELLNWSYSFMITHLVLSRPDVALSHGTYDASIECLGCWLNFSKLVTFFWKPCQNTAPNVAMDEYTTHVLRGAEDLGIRPMEARYSTVTEFNIPNPKLN